jgi:hypothetical protein
MAASNAISQTETEKNENITQSIDLKITVPDTITLLIKKNFNTSQSFQIVHSALDLMSLLYFT